MAHVSALSLVFLVYCSMLQQMGVEVEGPQKKIEWTRPHSWLVHTIKIFIDDEKAMLIPTSVSPDIRGGYQQIKRQYARNLMMMLLASKEQPVSVSACENVTSSVNVLFSEKSSMSKWSEVRVLRVEKISIASLKDVLVLTQFSRDLHGG